MRLPPTTELYTLSLHDALPISLGGTIRQTRLGLLVTDPDVLRGSFSGEVDVDFYGEAAAQHIRSEEHTSELQSLTNLVCRLLLEKKKNSPEDRSDHSMRRADAL